MPQLDFSNPLTISQVVWMLIIFGVLYYVLARYALPQVAHVVEARAARIAADLDGARIAKTESDQAAAEVTEAMRRASAESQAQVAAALNAAKAQAAEQARAADERLDARLAEAEQRIAQARQQALGALREVATDTATSLVARLTGRQPDAGQVAAAVDGALAVRAAA
jgi:F-type H+-transporting ATPase subunit b